VNNCKKLWLALRWKDVYNYDDDDVFSVQLTSLSNFETKEMSVVNLVLRLADGLRKRLTYTTASNCSNPSQRPSNHRYWVCECLERGGRSV